jgi:phosphomethylpyrimidine synthase
MTDLSMGLDASVTTGPIKGSTKNYRYLATMPGARVPLRRVQLSNSEQMDLYDTS